MINFEKRLCRQLTLMITFCISMLQVADGQSVQLTFRVDMVHEQISADGVHVAGDFQAAAGFGGNWQPGATEMADGDGDLIYELTVEVPPGIYLYKFVNGNEWSDKPELPSPDCSVADGGGNRNRQVIVGPAGSSLPPHPFDSCNAELRLSVNMNGMPVSAEGIHVMGDFQKAAGFAADWDPQSVPMADPNGDGTYEVVLPIVPGGYHYVFVNGSTMEDAEAPPAECAVDDGDGHTARFVQAAVGSPAPQTVCYQTCMECDPRITTEYETHWWNDAVFYEIFVRSFYDSDGDGIGDFQGIIEKLDYLNDGDPETTDDLGITGIWLMPMMPSPTYHGYDVTNYYEINPDYGTMADFDAFLSAAHDRGIRVIIDYVMNHCSNQHPWFTQSANSQNGFRDWFIWSDNNPGFTGPWGQPVWHQRNGDYYYGLFWSGMPDLNYDHPLVREEMMEIAAFWIDKGVDGFRLDAIKYLDEDGTILENTSGTMDILEELNTVYKTGNPEAVTVGEVWQNTQSVLPYVQNDRLDLCFDFDLAFSMVDAVNDNNPGFISNQLEIMQAGYRKLQYATFLSNHDIDRLYSRFSNSLSRAKQAASLLLTLPGIPFIYYGDEIGMTGTGIHENLRRPMQWDDGLNAGFTSGNPWYPLDSNFKTNHVAAMRDDPASLLSRHRELIHLRNASEPLRKGYLLNLPTTNPDHLAYARVYGDEAVFVVSSFGNIPSTINLSMPISSLVAGDYVVTDALTSADLGVLTLNAQGGFADWQPPSGLNPRETLVMHVSPAGTSSVKETTQAPWEVYPNPANDWIRFRTHANWTGSVQLSIFDVQGRMLLQRTLSDPSQTADISQLSAGAYFVKLTVDHYSTMRHLVIAR